MEPDAAESAQSQYCSAKAVCKMYEQVCNRSVKILKLDRSVDGMPSQNPHARYQRCLWCDGWKNNVAFAHPYHVRKSCSKFG